ncbi:MAG: hypothetical protein IJZ86_05555 [Bacteroides sp.]|nr:hypothetical protein [Bacteroides sp.]
MLKQVGIILFLVLFCATTFSVAQTQERLYPIEDFVGTWQYVNSDTVFTVKFVKGTDVNPSLRIERVRLFGEYSLQVDGVTLDDYLDVDSVLNSKLPVPEQKVYIKASASHSPMRVFGVTFYDQRKKHFDGKGIGGCSIVMVAPNKLHWELDESLGIFFATEGCEDCPEVKPIGFSVPTNVILTKVE